MDKASILGDAIEYVKDLQRRIKGLETHNKELQEESPAKQGGLANGNGTCGNVLGLVRNEDLNPTKLGSTESTEVSEYGHLKLDILIENEVAQLELECPSRQTLLLDILQTLIILQLDVFSIQASIIDGSLVTSLKAKVLQLVLQFYCKWLMFYDFVILLVLPIGMRLNPRMICHDIV